MTAGTLEQSGPPGAPPPLEVRTESGKGGVTRYQFSHAGTPIGTARMVGSTIGDIEVFPAHRRQGYGTQILHHLIDAGGHVAYAGSPAGEGLLRKAGFVRQGDQFVLP